MTIKQILTTYPAKLKKSSSPILDVEVLLQHVLELKKSQLYAYPYKALTSKQFLDFKKLFLKRQKSWPIAYLIGRAYFYGLELTVNPQVLIPRPETEILVEQVLKYLKNNKKSKKIADIGAGSGAIITSLAKNLENYKFYATDISAKALAVAEKNAKTHRILSKISFRQGDLLKPLKSVRPQILTANLPYLDKEEENLLNSRDSRSLRYEPKTALFGDSDGLDFYRKFFKQITEFKMMPEAIFLEIGHKQASQIKKLAQKSLPGCKIKILKDLCGFDRVVKITN